MKQRNSYRMTVLLLLGVMLLGGCSCECEPPSSTVDEVIERGRYLVMVGGCNDCHTPKVFLGGGTGVDDSRLLSGHPQELELSEYSLDEIDPEGWVLLNNHQTAAAGPWGVSFAANLTPDEDTGIGDWTAEEFIGAMRTWTHRGIGRPILPPMPWFNLATATDEGLQAMFAYQMEIPGVSNQVPVAIEPPVKKGHSNRPPPGRRDACPTIVVVTVPFPSGSGFALRATPGRAVIFAVCPEISTAPRWQATTPFPWGSNA